MDDAIALAERMLSERWGRKVSCAVLEPFERWRSDAMRLSVEGGPVSSVFLKAAKGEGDFPFKALDDSPSGPFWRFCNEWAGCSVLGPLGLGPAPIAFDAERACIIMEDIGAADSSAMRLQADDPARAAAAMLAYARGLGRLHRETRGQAERWVKLRGEAGGGDGGNMGALSFQLGIHRFNELLVRQEIAAPPGLAVELESIAAAMREPGAYNAFTPSDCCPDNHFLRNDEVVFFDCEFATMRHALLDASYFVTPFPTCWCVARLPAELAARMLAAYRAEFPGGSDFDQQMLMAQAAMTVGSLSQTSNWELEDQRRVEGLASFRQRHFLRLENMLAGEGLRDVLPALAQVLNALQDKLRGKWPDLEPAPLYPAFAGGGA